MTLGDTILTVFQRSADALLVIDGERFVDCNPAAVEMLRYGSKEELLQTHPSELSPQRQPDGRLSFEKANEMMAFALRKGSHRFEWDHKRADGDVFPVEVLLTAVPKGDGVVLHVVWRDISERRRLEVELRHAQKMEAVGKLAGGVAHDFNNLLVVILGYADLLRDGLDERSELQGFAEEIQNAGERAAEVTSQLLAFSRRQILRPELLDLQALVDALSGGILPLLGEDVVLSVDTEEKGAWVRADPGQLEQAIMNIASNARDAMPGGGHLSLGVTQRVVGHEEIPSLPGGEYVSLRIADDGEGMTAQTRERAFEPFFSGKPQGSGTGLGLASVYGLVKQSAGEVLIDSALGRGTVVEVLLPRCCGGEGEGDEPCGLPSCAVSQGETILVVEDDPAVAELVRRTLSANGYTVLQAADGLVGKECVSAHKGAVDLILSDVVMPSLGGPAMVRDLRAGGLDVPVLFMCGYSESNLEQATRELSNSKLLHKPFAVATLLSEVREALDGPRR